MIEPIADTQVLLAEPEAWIKTQAATGEWTLLAHTELGVIWGTVSEGAITLAWSQHSKVEVPFPPLRGNTLQKIWVFNLRQEIFAWRNGAVFLARRIDDGEGYAAPDAANTMDDHQVLWGIHDADAGGFTLLREGAQGFLHAPPITGLAKDDRAVLTMRHYLAEDELGRTYIAATRFVALATLTGMPVEQLAEIAE